MGDCTSQGSHRSCDAKWQFFGFSLQASHNKEVDKESKCLPFRTHSVFCAVIVVIYMDSTLYVVTYLMLLAFAVVMCVHCCECERIWSVIT